MILGEEMVDEGFFSCCFLMFDLLCAFPTCYLILYSPSLLAQYGQAVTGMTAVCLLHLILQISSFPSTSMSWPFHLVYQYAMP